MGTTNMKEKIMVISYDLSIKSSTSQNRTTSTYTVEQTVHTNMSNVIVSCTGRQNMDTQAMCEAMGSDFDPNTNKCIPKSKCYSTGNYIQLTCYIEGRLLPYDNFNTPCVWISENLPRKNPLTEDPNDITTGYSCPEGSTGIRTYSHDREQDVTLPTGPKGGDETHTRRDLEWFYSCMRCPES